MRASKRLLLMMWVSATAPAALAADGWEVVTESPYLVKTRPLPNSDIQEVWAEGVIDAPVREIQETLMDPDTFSRFMPYVKEGRHIREPLPDGSRYVYVRLQLPMVTSRDYVTRVWLLKGVNPDGTGEFENKWVAVPDLLPARSNVVRLKFNQGGWKVTPRPDGKAYAVYRFSVDPGGSVPAFAANMGNRSGVPDTFKAVEGEAKRRAALRKTKEARAP
jgi:hypothetical protein